MGLVLATVTGICVWIVLWSLDYKAIDAFMITVVVALVAVMVRMLVPHLPGRRRA